MSFLEIIDLFKKECSCGKIHTTSIQDVKIGSGLVNQVGDILTKNGFCD